MKIILFSRPRVRHVAEHVRQIFSLVEQYRFEIVVNEEFAPQVEEYVGRSITESMRYGEDVGEQQGEAVMVCYGGDGTLLEGASRLNGREIPVVGINSGRMGFLTGAPTENIETIFRLINEQRLTIEPRTMVAVKGGMVEEPQKVRYALNEVALQRSGAQMLSIEMYVDEQLVATYHGDGVIISTPTGSTAYSLSAGGPVVAPQCHCLIISPIAPHNLTMRPVVIPDTSRICLRVVRASSGAFCLMDNRSEQLAEGAEMVVTTADRRIFLAVPHNISFYDTLRNKMMWGVDLRS